MCLFCGCEWLLGFCLHYLSIQQLSGEGREEGREIERGEAAPKPHSEAGCPELALMMELFLYIPSIKCNFIFFSIKLSECISILTISACSEALALSLDKRIRRHIRIYRHGIKFLFPDYFNSHKTEANQTKIAKSEM